MSVKIQFILKYRAGYSDYDQYDEYDQYDQYDQYDEYDEYYEYDEYNEYNEYEEYGEPYLDNYGGPYEDSYTESYTDALGNVYSDTYTGSLSSGLANSATFIAAAFNSDPNSGIEAEVCFVSDNNLIDKEVTRFKPNIVIIEAYWVVPSKFAILTRKHPKVTWIVRNHSEIPFAAQEGIVMEWSLKYPKYPNVYVACNSTRSFMDLSILINAVYPNENKQLLYLPNMYPKVSLNKTPKVEDNYFDVACFGAIRPLKNQLMQAVAAISFAEQLGKTLRFHVNTITGGVTGSAILKNLSALFKLLPNAQLVQHPWYPHDDFLDVLKGMDLGMQVSFSETFNIISADMVASGLPLVVSSETSWAPSTIYADPTDCCSILSVMNTVWLGRQNRRNQDVLPTCVSLLNGFSEASFKQWLLEVKNLNAP